jgi:hypothetical protein
MKLCKSFHKDGACLYGIRCCFIHDEKNFDEIFGRFKYSMILGFNNALGSFDSHEMRRTHGAYTYLNHFINEDKLGFSHHQTPTQAGPPGMPQMPSFTPQDGTTHTGPHTYKKTNTALHCIEDGLHPQSLSNFYQNPTQAHNHPTSTQHRNLKKPKFGTRRLKCFESCHRKGLEQEYRKSIETQDIGSNGQAYNDSTNDFFSDDFEVVYDQNFDNQVDEYINLYLRDDDEGVPFVF